MKLRFTSLNISWDDCPRCHGNHMSVSAQQFEEPIGGGYTHFAICPNRSYPVLFRVLGEEDIVFSRTLEKLTA